MTIIDALWLSFNRRLIKSDNFHEYHMSNCCDHTDDNPLITHPSIPDFRYANCPTGYPFTYAYTSLGEKTDGALRFLYYWEPECPIVE